MSNRPEFGAVMSESKNTFSLVAICTTIAIGFALYFTRSVLAPVVFALFVIAVVWPVQRVLQTRMPSLVAAVLTVAVTLVTVVFLGLLLTWGFGRVAQWFVSNAPRLQLLYEQMAAQLEQHGIMVIGPLSDFLNVSWLVRVLQQLSGHIQGLATFIVVTFIFVLLGLLEVDIFREKLMKMRNRETANSLLAASADIGAKMQKYMMVRTLMSIMTGVVVWAFALVAGMELATAWGVIAFVLNYIPFLGPLVATVFPTVFAFVQFESWQMAVLIFVVLNVIQFVIGSYLEPRIAGAALAVSPFIVLFAVFFWTFLWGIAGAFIGVPITIAVLATCDVYPSTKWLAELFSAEAKVG